MSHDVPSLFSGEVTIIFGADVIHPAPGSGSRPSFTSLVGTLDTEQSKYIARVAVQESRVEMITDLQKMAGEILNLYVLLF
ncbi:MAG TPA: Piwi domain-containing protein, partial [Chlamydiales bacterium]|nr:Piwi domain-containing protein [Chlamydiales bacterium]